LGGRGDRWTPTTLALAVGDPFEHEDSLFDAFSFLAKFTEHCRVVHYLQAVPHLAFTILWWNNTRSAVVSLAINAKHCFGLRVSSGGIVQEA
jgi:hypothetical protein